MKSTDMDDGDDVAWCQRVANTVGETICTRGRLRLLPLLAALCEVEVKSSTLARGKGDGEEDVVVLRTRPLSRAVHEPPSHTNGVFLLLGQSNMSGRGDGGEPSFEIGTESPASFFFDPILGWSPVAGTSFLHKNVDLLKNAGLGPGNAFAADMEELLGEGVLLIPGAVGGTSLEEWMPNYISALPSPPLNARWHDGCPNLLSCAFRQLRLSGVPSPSGILWYQGENDATLKLKAESYAENFSMFLSSFRELLEKFFSILGADDASKKSPPNTVVPIVTVAVTSTRESLEHLAVVREQQLSVVAEALAVVDAFGCELKSDCIHLHGLAASRLGREIARQMSSLLVKAVPAEAFSAPETDQGDSLVGPRSFLDSPWDVDNAEHFRAAITNANTTASVFRGGSKWRQSGYAAVNFVQGQVLFLDFCRVLRIVERLLPSPLSSGDCCEFVDLGCGVGACMAAALLFRSSEVAAAFTSQLFTAVRGFDLMESKVHECCVLLQALQASSKLADVGGLSEESLSHAADWSRASVVYACATCFDAEVMKALEDVKLPLLGPGAVVVLVDKQLDEARGNFLLVSSLQVRATWGFARIRIYLRTDTLYSH